jgi:hypothetical protein
VGRLANSMFFRDGKAHLLARRLEQLNVEGMRDEA